jgi:hypothetical protein
MGESRLKAGFITLTFGVSALFFVLAPTQTVLAAALHNVNGWAWSGTTGWISMNCEDAKPGFPSGDCGAGNGNYGLDIDQQGNLSGWAWSTNAGWMCFGSTCNAANSSPLGTPTADHYCPSHSPCAHYEPSEGEVHGWAYVVSETDGTNYRGWVSLNCTDVGSNTSLPRNCSSADYALSVDETSGDFSSLGSNHSYGWNGNGDATGNGWVQFACGFPRPCGGAGWDSIDQQEGIYTSNPPPATGNSLTTIPITFRNLSASKDSTLSCSLRTSNGSYKILSWPITSRTAKQTVAETYTISATDSLADASGNPVLWSFSSAPGPTPYGCAIAGNPNYSKTVPNLVAVHPPGWTFAGPGGSSQADSNRADFCLQGNLGADPSRGYFLNTAQCDVDGDLAYTLLKAKGIPVEINCRDNVDNNGDSAIDFTGPCNAAIPLASSDRTCRGITYLCVAPKPALPCSGNCPNPQP